MKNHENTQNNLRTSFTWFITVITLSKSPPWSPGPPMSSLPPFRLPTNATTVPSPFLWWPPALGRPSPIRGRRRLAPAIAAAAATSPGWKNGFGGEISSSSSIKLWFLDAFEIVIACWRKHGDLSNHKYTLAGYHAFDFAPFKQS